MKTPNETVRRITQQAMERHRLSQRGLALGGQLLGPCGEGAQLHPGLLHHGAVAAHAGAVSQGGPDAPAVDGGEPAHRGDGEARQRL